MPKTCAMMDTPDVPEPAEAIKQFEKYLESGKTIQYRDEVAAKIEALKLTLKP